MTTTEHRANDTRVASDITATHARLMFAITLTTLAALAIILPHGVTTGAYDELIWGNRVLLGIILAGWLAIVAESVWGLLNAPDKWQAPARRLAFLTLLSPFRMTIATALPNHRVWLPLNGWLDVGRDQFERLERQLALPMLLITLLVLPAIAIELFFNQWLENSAGVALALHFVTAIIWLAFTVEFILMVSISDKKLHYCKRHWINIVIILLPLFAFLRTLQLFRFLRFAKAGKLLRAYRLRGLITRALQLALMFNLIERVMERNLGRYVSHLEEKIGDKEEELAALRAKHATAVAKLAASAEADSPEKS